MRPLDAIRSASSSVSAHTAIVHDEVGERVRQPQLGRPDGALRRRAEQPRLGALRPAREQLRVPGEDVVGRHAVLEQGEQLGELLREIVGRGLTTVALERQHRQGIGAWGAAEAEVDALGMEPGERAEHLGHLERAVVGQHHAAAADPHRLRVLRDRRDQHLGRRTCERRRGVVFREPVALVAEALGVPGEVNGVRQRLGAGLVLRDRRLVENAELHG
jgi:hypothetical protein